MADETQAPTPPTKRRQEQTGTGEGAQVSAAPTDKPVDVEEPYVGVDDIYRNHADDLNAPLLGDGDDLMEQAITVEKERRTAAERVAMLGVAALAPNPNLEGVEPTDPERAEEAAKQREKRDEAQRQMDEQTEKMLEEVRQTEAEAVRAQADSLRQAADSLEQSVK